MLSSRESNSESSGRSDELKELDLAVALVTLVASVRGRLASMEGNVF